MTEDIKQFVDEIERQPTKIKNSITEALKIVTQFLKLETSDEPLKLETNEIKNRSKKLERINERRERKKKKWLKKEEEIETRIMEHKIPSYLADIEKQEWEFIEEFVMAFPKLREYKEKLINDGNSAESTFEALSAQFFIDDILRTRPDLKKHLRNVSAVVNLNELNAAFEVESRITEIGQERAKKVEEFIKKRQKTYQDTLPSDILDEMKQSRL